MLFASSLRRCPGPSRKCARTKQTTVPICRRPRLRRAVAREVERQCARWISADVSALNDYIIVTRARFLNSGWTLSGSTGQERVESAQGLPFRVGTGYYQGCEG